jgi:hypothetical protein
LTARLEGHAEALLAFLQLLAQPVAVALGLLALGLVGQDDHQAADAA